LIVVAEESQQRARQVGSVVDGRHRLFCPLTSSTVLPRGWNPFSDKKAMRRVAYAAPD
jgi:hypothetical protein